MLSVVGPFWTVAKRNCRIQACGFWLPSREKWSALGMKFGWTRAFEEKTHVTGHRLDGAAPPFAAER